VSIGEYGVAAALTTAMWSTPVLVPWRTDGGAREENWALVEKAMWAGWHLLVSAEGPTGPFNRSAALNDAYAWSVFGRDVDVVIVADADSMVGEDQLARAIRTARVTGRLTVAHDRWLNVETHERTGFLAGEPINEKRVRRGSYLRPRAVVRGSVSSMLVVPTALWDKVGGFDERFVGWGFEDRAFHRMCERARGGYERIPGPVYHLDHERPAADLRRSRDAGYRANRDLWAEYRRAGTADELERVRWPEGRP